MTVYGKARVGDETPDQVAGDRTRGFVIAVDGLVVVQDSRYGDSSFPLIFPARSMADRALQNLPYAIGRDAEIVEIPRS